MQSDLHQKDSLMLMRFFIEILISTQYQLKINQEEERKSGKNQFHFHIKLTGINEKWFLRCYVLV